MVRFLYGHGGEGWHERVCPRASFHDVEPSWGWLELESLNSSTDCFSSCCYRSVAEEVLCCSVGAEDYWPSRAARPSRRPWCVSPRQSMHFLQFPCLLSPLSWVIFSGFLIVLSIAGFAASSSFFAASAVAEDAHDAAAKQPSDDDGSPSTEDMKEAQKGAPVLRYHLECVFTSILDSLWRILYPLDLSWTSSDEISCRIVLTGATWRPLMTKEWQVSNSISICLSCRRPLRWQDDCYGLHLRASALARIPRLSRP